MSQPLNLREALLKSTYPIYNHEFLKDFMTKTYSNNELAKVYLTSIDDDKIFVVEYILSIRVEVRMYKVNVLMYLPILFPDYPPEFYIMKKGNVGVHENYRENKINSTDLKINIDYFVPFDPEKKNIDEIIRALISAFNQYFPVFRKENTENDQIQSGKCILNKKSVNEVIIENNKNVIINNNNPNVKYYYDNKNINYNDKIQDGVQTFSDNGQDCFLDYTRNQVKDRIKEKYMEFEEKKTKLNMNYNDLKTINESLQMSINKSNNSKSPIEEEIKILRKIKEKLNNIEKNLIKENEEMKKAKEVSVFEKCPLLVQINDEKYLEYTAMIKTIKDYLIFMKKGFEKNIISFEDMVANTRRFSRELFTIYYIRDHMHKKTSV